METAEASERVIIPRAKTNIDASNTTRLRREAAVRKRLVDKGGRPRLSEYTRRRYFKLRDQGKTQKDAASLVGISKSSGEKMDKDRRKDPAARKLWIPPEPRKYADLPPAAKRACEDFDFFLNHYLKLAFPPWATEVGTKLLEAYHSPDEEYIVLNASPNAGKTTLVTYGFVTWVIARERAMGQEPTFLLIHRSVAKALWYVRRIRNAFTYNYDMVEDFGRFRPEANSAPWAAEEFMVEPLDWNRVIEKEPTVTAGSYEGSIVSGHFGFIIADDLLDKSNQITAEQREKVENFWEQEAETRLNTGGTLVLSNARYGPEDLCHFLLRQTDPDDPDEEGKPRPLYTHLAYPAHFESKCNHVTHEGPWPSGCLLDPKQLTWKRIHRQIVKNEGRFALVYQQEDADPMGFVFDKVWFEGGKDARGWEAPGCFDDDRGFGQLPMRPDAKDPSVNVVTLDPSGSRFWSMHQILEYPGEIQYIVRGLRRPMQAPDILYRGPDGVYTGFLEDWWQAANKDGIPFRYFVVEYNATQRWLTQYEFFQSWGTLRHVTIMGHETKKQKRDPDYGVPMCGPIFRDGRLRLPYMGYEERVYSDQFAREAAAWPEGATEDMVMSYWFPQPILSQLRIGKIVDERDADGYVRNVPRFVQSMQKPPKWVDRMQTGEDRVPAFAGGRR